MRQIACGKYNTFYIISTCMHKTHKKSVPSDLKMQSILMKFSLIQFFHLLMKSKKSERHLISFNVCVCLSILPTPIFLHSLLRNFNISFSVLSQLYMAVIVVHHHHHLHQHIPRAVQRGVIVTPICATLCMMM